MSNYHHYDDAAASYDGHFTRPVDEWEDGRLAELLRPVVDGRIVLDLGCGTGWVADHLAPRDYTGVDCSGPMLAELARKHPAARTVKAEVGAEAWTRALPYRRYPVITATWSLEYLGDLDILLSVCARLCVPGGVLALHGSLPRGHHRDHFSVKSAPYRPLSARLVRQASVAALLPRPQAAGTGALPDTWTRLGRRAWTAALAAPAGRHYAALWTWRLPS
jgi:predicted TPR repeat methyltransferase